jgi:hypothetical protein
MLPARPDEVAQRATQAAFRIYLRLVYQTLVEPRFGGGGAARAQCTADATVQLGQRKNCARTHERIAQRVVLDGQSAVIAHALRSC